MKSLAILGAGMFLAVMTRYDRRRTQAAYGTTIVGREPWYGAFKGVPCEGWTLVP